MRKAVASAALADTDSGGENPIVESSLAGTHPFAERKGLAKRVHATSLKARKNPGFTNGIADRHHVMHVRPFKDGGNDCTSGKETRIHSCTKRTNENHHFLFIS